MEKLSFFIIYFFSSFKAVDNTDLGKSKRTFSLSFFFEKLIVLFTVLLYIFSN